jgi:hypothetical protein
MSEVAGIRWLYSRANTGFTDPRSVHACPVTIPNVGVPPHARLLP